MKVGNENFPRHVGEESFREKENSMPSKFLIAASIASFIVLASAAPPAGAQSTQEQTQPTGRTSGPAAGTPTHMGSGATSSPETKHQSEAVGEQR